jgi:CheY-like chemotaxis protein
MNTEPKKKLLLIEDDPVVCNLYRGLFEREGFNVAVCMSGQEGFYAIHEQKPDVVLLDLMLPGIGGTEILKKIRAQASFAALPIFVFTNAYLPEIIEQARGAGATAIYNKATVSPRELADALRAAASGKAAPAPASQKQAAPAKAAKAPVDDASVPADQQEAALALRDRAPGLVNETRQSLQALAKAGAQDDVPRLLDDIFRRVRALASLAAAAGQGCLTQFASALEALMRELHDKPKCLNASTLRTLGHALDLLSALMEGAHSRMPLRPITVLAVDDEPISRKALLLALDRASIRAICASGPELALAICSENAFDLIVLDVNMPGLNGFELCAKLRSLPQHRQTPVVFVTAMSDFESRAKSTVSGGSDFMGKPFVFMELNLKVLTHILRQRLAAAATAPAPARGFDTTSRAR